MDTIKPRLTQYIQSLIQGSLFLKALQTILKEVMSCYGFPKQFYCENIKSTINTDVKPLGFTHLDLKAKTYI